jgi:hypothetical protein
MTSMGGSSDTLPVAPLSSSISSPTSLESSSCSAAPTLALTTEYVEAASVQNQKGFKTSLLTDHFLQPILFPFDEIHLCPIALE